MTVITALLFGLIIGFSEFIPISSSGHLSILKNLFGIITDGYSHNLFFAFLDLGCLVSVWWVRCWYFGYIMYSVPPVRCSLVMLEP